MIQLFIVEDNSADVYLVKESMRRAGLTHELQLATDGEEALAMITRFGNDLPCPDIMLLDLNLPREDGSEVLKRWRSHSMCQNRPVVVTTSSEVPSDRKMAQEYDAAFFHKPLNLAEYLGIAEIIRQLCGTSGES